MVKYLKENFFVRYRRFDSFAHVNQLHFMLSDFMTVGWKPSGLLAVELTDAGRAVAQPLLLAEQDRIRAEQRAAEVVVLPLVPAAGLPAGGTSATDLAVELNGITYQACRGDFVVRLDGSTCLQLWNKEGRVVRREGDPLEVAQWLQACHDAGIEVRVQINESAAP